jgi:phospholipase/carboxylesterase
MTDAVLDHRPSDDVDHAAILLHARGRPPGEMRDLAGSLGLLAWRCVFPAAPDLSWYPAPFLSPIEDNEAALGEALAQLDAVADRLCDEGFPPERILIGGFSQGACLAATALLRRPERRLGALILSGGLLGAPGTVFEPAPALAGMPAYLSGSRGDPWAPVFRIEETADWLRRSGASVRLEIADDRAHVIDDREIALARSFLETLGPLGADQTL